MNMPVEIGTSGLHYTRTVKSWELLEWVDTSSNGARSNDTDGSLASTQLGQHTNRHSHEEVWLVLMDSERNVRLIGLVRCLGKVKALVTMRTFLNPMRVKRGRLIKVDIADEKASPHPRSNNRRLLHAHWFTRK